MAEYKIVDATQLDEDLTSICDEIRTLDNHTDKLSFPDGIKKAIATLATNIGYTSYGNGYSDGEANADEILYSIIGRTGTELYINASRFGNGAFYNWADLTKARLPLGQLFLAYSFRNCTGLTTLDIGDPARTDIYTTSNSEDLYFANNTFNGASALQALILRPNIVAKLQGTQVFSGTPIASGTGYIYVPSALVDSYKAAANWSTYADQIRAIEDYPEITGGE